MYEENKCFMNSNLHIILKSLSSPLSPISFFSPIQTDFMAYKSLTPFPLM